MTTRPALLAVAAVLVAAALPPQAASASVLEQLRGGAGCRSVASFPDDRCGPARGMFGPDAVATSPDGRHVYVATRDPDNLIDIGSSSIAAFARDRATGVLRQVGCVSDDGGDGRDGTEGLCLDGDALESANAVAVAPDGRHVYATSDAGGIAILARDARTGRLTPAGCVKDYAPDSRCADADGMPRPVSLAVSPDGHQVYVTSRGSHAVIAFARDGRTGALRQIGCVSDDGTGGTCADGEALGTPTAIALSPDGRSAYVTGGYGQDSVVTFARDAGTGLLAERGCHIFRPPADSPCEAGRGIVDASGVVVAPDGRTVYTTAIESAAVATFARDPATGALRQLDCIANGGGYYESSGDLREGCRRGAPLDFASALAIDHSGRRLVVIAAGANSIQAYARDRGTGTLRLEDCLTWRAPARTRCRPARGLFGAKGLAVTPAGDAAFVAADTGNALAVFRLDR